MDTIGMHFIGEYRPKNAAKQSYDRLSHYYDLLAGSSDRSLIQIGVELLGVRPGERILEVGCGTGLALGSFCLQAGDQGEVFGLDLSSGMIRMADSRLSKADLVRRAHLLRGDGAALPFHGSHFTSVFMSFTLELFDTPEIPLVLAECWRVLKPGGRLGVVAMQKPKRFTWIVRLYEWFHEHFPTYVDCRPIDVHASIQAAGFRLQQQVLKHLWGLPVALIVAEKL